MIVGEVVTPWTVATIVSVPLLVIGGVVLNRRNARFAQRFDRNRVGAEACRQCGESVYAPGNRLCGECFADLMREMNVKVSGRMGSPPTATYQTSSLAPLTPEEMKAFEEQLHKAMGILKPIPLSVPVEIEPLLPEDEVKEDLVDLLRELDE